MSEGLSGSAAREIGDDLLILFPHGTRPTVRRVHGQRETGGYADVSGPDLTEYRHKFDIGAPTGLALQRAGLVFDLVGLAPGPAIPAPDMGEADRRREPILPTRTEATSLRLGPHIAAGKRSLAILREWFGLASGIAETFGATALCWVPGRVVIGIDRLPHHLQAWDGRGDVPVNLLADFRSTLDGAVQSSGLAFFTGQEFRIEPPLVRGGEDALARLIFSHLFYAGEQTATGQLAAPDGTPLRLEPSGNRRFVRVWPG